MIELRDFPGYWISEDGTIMNPKGKLVSMCIDSKGYHRVNLPGGNCKVHRLLAQTYIPNPDNLPCVDHINRNRSDNRLANLRWVSYTENAQNRSTPYTNALGHQHICMEKGVYLVKIVRDGKTVYQASHKTLELAIEARDLYLETGEQIKRTSESGHKNICKRGKKWRLTLRKGTPGKIVLDEYYLTLEEAIKARDEYLSSL